MRKTTILFSVLCLSVAPLLAHAGHHHGIQPESTFDWSLLGFSGLHEVFNVHPAFVHFPIALVPTALFFYALGILLKSRALNLAGRACLYLSLAGGVAVILTGLRAQETFPHNELIHHMMQTHKSLGLLLGLVLTGLTAWSFWHLDHQPKGPWLFWVLLLFATYLVLQNGDLGSRMVYVQGAAVKPLAGAMEAADEPAQLEEGHHHNH